MHKFGLSVRAAAMGVACIVLTIPVSAHAQIAPVPAVAPPARGAATWRTLSTEHFSFYYRAEFEAWTQSIASRMEAVRAAVQNRVGYAPEERVTILVDDPRNESNGNAISWLDDPQIQIFPVPPSPRSQLGNARDWGELLVVHEFAHIAHLTRPSRGAGSWFDRLPFMAANGPLAQTPRWVKEGYATFIEGTLTGSGRPSSVIRAAILRQFAADGMLPTYSALNSGSGFLLGNFAYLMGSAFLEHLTATYGDSTLPQLWRRLSARTERSFPAAFEQTFGVQPDEAYATYAVRLSANALAIRAALDSAGRVEGTLEVKGTGALGDPAVSPDGKRVALTRGGGVLPSRVVVWPTAPAPAETDSAKLAHAARLKAADSLDLLPVASPPRTKREIASLPAYRGFSYSAPRFMTDMGRLLVVRSDVQSDGSVMPDLFEWQMRSGHVRRITHGAAVRDADPFPGDKRAVGTRCAAGHCDLVLIDLHDGRVTTLLAGTPFVEYVRPRVSPDGARIVASEQREGRWRAVLVDPASGAVTHLGPNDASNRYDFAWTRDGRAVLGVSEATGIANIERIDVATGSVTPLSRVFGAAMAPEPMPGDSVAFFLTLESRGYDLRRLSLTDTRAAGDLPQSAQRLLGDLQQGAIVTQPEFSAPAFATAPTSAPAPYGLGPQRIDWFPVGGGATGGGFAGLAIYGSDPNDRFSWQAEHLFTAGKNVLGGSVARASLRLRVATFDAEFTHSRLDAEDYTGGSIAASRAVRDAFGLTSLRAGAASHQVNGDAREHIWAAVNRTLSVGGNLRSLALDMRAQASRTSGLTVGTDHVVVTHRVGMLVADANADGIHVSVEVSAGDTRGNMQAEPFALGGLGSRLIDQSVVPQNVAVPWLSAGELSGTTFRAQTMRAPIAGGVDAFESAVRVGGGTWRHALGAEASRSTFGSGFNRVAGISETAGVAYLLDGPHKYGARAWVAITLNR